MHPAVDEHEDLMRSVTLPAIDLRAAISDVGRRPCVRTMTPAHCRQAQSGNIVEQLFQRVTIDADQCPPTRVILIAQHRGAG